MSNQSKTTISLTNSIHGTSCNVRVYEGQETFLERNTVLRIRRELCPDKKCDKCKGVLNEVGETNPKVEERDGDVYVLYKVGNVEKTTKPVKMSDYDKQEKEKEVNYIHYTELEAKIMASALGDDEKSKLFDFIRDIRNEDRELAGLEPL